MKKFKVPPIFAVALIVAGCVLTFPSILIAIFGPSVTDEHRQESELMRFLVKEGHAVQGTVISGHSLKTSNMVDSPNNTAHFIKFNHLRSGEFHTIEQRVDAQQFDKLMKNIGKKVDILVDPRDAKIARMSIAISSEAILKGEFAIMVARVSKIAWFVVAFGVLLLVGGMRLFVHSMQRDSEIQS